MTFEILVKNLIADTLRVSLPGFMPELILCTTIVLMLLVRLPRIGRRFNAFFVALPGALLALYFTAPWRYLVKDIDLAFPADALLNVPIFTR